MKVLWISHIVPFPPVAGVSVRSGQILRAMCADHEVDFVGFRLAKLERGATTSGNTAAWEGICKLNRICRQVHLFGQAHERSRLQLLGTAVRSLFSSLPFAAKRFGSAEVARRIERLCRESHYDLVHFETIGLCVHLPAIAGTHVSLNHHNIESALMGRRATAESNFLRRCWFRLEAFKMRRLEARVCEKVSVNFTCSGRDSTELLERFPSCIAHTIPNVVDVEHFRRQSKQIRNAGKVHFLFVGSFTWQPNVDAIQELCSDIWPAIQKALPGSELHIVGAPVPEWLKNLTMHSETLHAHGFINDLKAQYALADIFICPIRWGGGTKIKLLEAMSMSIAIIADPVACEGLELRDSESVLHAKSTADFVTQASLLLSNGLLYSQIVTEARETAETLYSEAVGRKKVLEGLTRLKF